MRVWYIFFPQYYNFLTSCFNLILPIYIQIHFLTHLKLQYREKPIRSNTDIMRSQFLTVLHLS